MKLDHIDNYHLAKTLNHWFVGDFEKSLFKTSACEVGLHLCFKGESKAHFHPLTTEYNIILEGLCIVNGKRLSKGAIFVYEPNDISDVKFVDTTILLVIRNGSYPCKDKVDL